MLDIATKNHKAILGINIRYIIDGKVIERCIGMIALIERHTSANIAIEVKKCIDKFGISLKQVKSITTDNAANVIGIVDHLNDKTLCTIEEEEETVNELRDIDEIIPDQTIDEVNDDEISSLARHILEEEALEAYLDDSDVYDDLLKKVIENLPHHFNENTVNVRCGSHTLHLIVRASLKKSNIQELVTVCQKAAKLLRQETYVREARKCNLQYNLPHLNVETRWDSDYTMVIFFYRYVCFEMKGQS